MSNVETVAEPTVRYGLYVRGQKVSHRFNPWKFRWGGKRGWYTKTSIFNPATNCNVEIEKIIDMVPCFGRLKYEARNAVVPTWGTKEEAETAAFMIVSRRPEWIGTLEVRRCEAWRPKR